eukprot:1127654-Rhodomonas_salina.2
MLERGTGDRSRDRSRDLPRIADRLSLMSWALIADVRLSAISCCEVTDTASDRSCMRGQPPIGERFALSASQSSITESDTKPTEFGRQDWSAMMTFVTPGAIPPRD